MLDRVYGRSHVGSTAAAAQPPLLRSPTLAAFPALVSSPGVTWTSKSDAKYAHVNVDSAVTSADKLLLDRLLDPAAKDASASRLQELTDGGWAEGRKPDFLAVRTGPGVTAEFSGGGRVTAWTNGSTGTTVYYFGGGTKPDAFKGVAIAYGSDATPADRTNEKLLAMGFLAEHLDDRRVAGGSWNRPLIDALL